MPVLQYRQQIQKMKKEDYQPNNNGIPIDLIFIPESLQIEFKQKIKLQVAFYRGSKVCKSAPAKFLRSNVQSNRIALDQEKLHFCTTIGYDADSKTFESKIINVQLAYQADAEKETIDAKIDLKDILSYQANFQKSGLVVTIRSDIKLFYGINGKITNFKPVQHIDATSPVKVGGPKKSTVAVVEQKQNKQAEKVGIDTMNNARNEKTNRQQHLQAQIESITKKLKAFEQKHREISKKYQHVNQQNSNLKMKLKQSQSGNQQKQKQITEIEKLLQRITEQKNTLLANLGKKGLEEQEAQKKNQIIDKLHQEIDHLKSVNSEYKNKIEDVRKTQAQIRLKYQESQKKNLGLISQLSDSQYRYQKLQKEHQKSLKTIEKLERQLTENSNIDNLKSDNDENSKSKDAQIQKLTKLLEVKEEVIRMMKKQTEMKKTEQNEDINFLKKQNKQLKEEIDKFKDPKKDSSALELKIQNEKLKKQCLEAKREQKKMLSEKSEIDNKNKQMHLQIVRLKQTIGKILNIVQEEGSSDLFTQIADCVA